MTKKQRYEWILDYFRREMPEVQTELEFGSEFQLLVAVMLSGVVMSPLVEERTRSVLLLATFILLWLRASETDL